MPRKWTRGQRRSWRIYERFGFNPREQDGAEAESAASEMQTVRRDRRQLPRRYTHADATGGSPPTAAPRGVRQRVGSECRVSAIPDLLRLRDPRSEALAGHGNHSRYLIRPGA